MSSAGATSRRTSAGERAQQSRLRLIDNRDQRIRGDERSQQAASSLHQYGDSVLVAGADPAARARMLAELRSLLPDGTVFRQASETWEVIAQASESRMVVLAGDLGETSASALLRLLARRNPSLPVLAVGSDRRLHGRAHGRGPDDGPCSPEADAAHA